MEKKRKNYYGIVSLKKYRDQSVKLALSPFSATGAAGQTASRAGAYGGSEVGSLVGGAVGPPIIGPIVGNIVGDKVGTRAIREAGLDTVAGQVRPNFCTCPFSHFDSTIVHRFSSTKICPESSAKKGPTKWARSRGRPSGSRRANTAYAAPACRRHKCCSLL